MARRGRRSGSGNAGTILGIVAAALALVVVGGGMVWFVLDAYSKSDPLDPQTLCPRSGVKAQTIVLLDTTDEFAEVTRSDILNKLKDVIAAIPRGGLLDIRSLNEDPSKIGRLLEPPLCNPGDGRNAPNPEFAQRRWNEKFGEVVDVALRDAITGGEQNASPILAAIQQIAAELLANHAGRAIPTRIVVVSDLLEHTPYYSHFTDGLDFETYLQMVGARYLTDLAGAQIDFWMVQRDRAIDRTALAQFWLLWAAESNGHGTVLRLMGMD